MLNRLVAVAAVVALTTMPTDLKAQCGRQGVVAYEASWCSFCRLTRQFFAANNVVYQAFDIDETPGVKTFLTSRLGPGWGMPVTFIDGNPIIGYDPDALRAALCLR